MEDDVFVRSCVWGRNDIVRQKAREGREASQALLEQLANNNPW
jgi:hypothetical protein